MLRPALIELVRDCATRAGAGEADIERLVAGVSDPSVQFVARGDYYASVSGRYVETDEIGQEMLEDRDVCRCPVALSYPVWSAFPEGVGMFPAQFDSATRFHHIPGNPEVVPVFD